MRKIIPDAAIPYLKQAFRGTRKKDIMDREMCLITALEAIKNTGIGGEIMAHTVARRIQNGENIKMLAKQVLDCVTIGRTAEEIKRWKINNIIS